MPRPHLLFVTGKLAEPALRRTLAQLAPRVEFDYTVAVLPITVAALATTPWVAKHLTIPEQIDRILLPGLCAGELHEVPRRPGVSIERGPKDLLDLPEFFGGAAGAKVDYGACDITILAEINHVPQMNLAEILVAARSLRASGADIIDLGCDPGSEWVQGPRVADAGAARKPALGPVHHAARRHAARLIHDQ